MRFVGIVLALSFGLQSVHAEAIKQTKGHFEDKFRQLEEHLPTPNMYRTGSGAPGHGYWQQKVDYSIKVKLDEKARMISGSETITYQNKSPDTLTYLWLQLDQNRFSKHSDAYTTMEMGREAPTKLSFSRFVSLPRQKVAIGVFTSARCNQVVKTCAIPSMTP